MDFQLPDGDSIRLMAPFADMLNHSSEVKQCHAYDALSGNISILAGKNYEPGDQVRPSCFLILPTSALNQRHSSRFSSTMGLFQTIAFYVSMGSSCPAIPTTATISSSRHTPWRHSSSKSTNSGRRLGSIRPPLSLLLSPIRYQEVSSDTSVFNGCTNRILPS